MTVTQELFNIKACRIVGPLPVLNSALRFRTLSGRQHVGYTMEALVPLEKGGVESTIVFVVQEPSVFQGRI